MQNHFSKKKIFFFGLPLEHHPFIFVVFFFVWFFLEDGCACCGEREKNRERDLELVCESAGVPDMSCINYEYIL